jgi:hypothetical protein
MDLTLYINRRNLEQAEEALRSLDPLASIKPSRREGSNISGDDILQATVTVYNVRAIEGHVAAEHGRLAWRNTQYAD